MRLRTILAAVAAPAIVAGALALAPLSPAASAATYPALTRVHDPGHVTGTMHGRCYLRAGGKLPDPRCTPGSFDPAMTRARLCAPGYRTATYRPPSSQTTRAKYRVVEPAYGQRSVTGELDHLVPLELGGSNDMTNFWVEAGKIPNPKDTVENRLHREMCAGQISLRTAQLDIAHNWMTAPAHASLTPTSAAPSIGSESSKIWGGYVLQAKAGHRFSQVYAEFTVPRGMSRGKVLRDYRSPVSPYYGLAAFWAGLGGWNGAAILEQGGVEAFVTQHGLVQYRAFTEMFPAQPGAIWLPLNYEVNGNDKPLPQAATIHAGDHMAVQVDDDASTLKDTGRSYTIFVMDLTQNRYGFRTERTTAANHGHDQTAEVITEAPGGGPSGRLHTGLLNTGTVRYTNAYAGVFGEAMFGLGPRPEWDTTKVTLGHFWLRHPVGHFWVPAYYNKVVETGRLGGYTPPSPKGGGGEGMHSFNTYWNAG